MEIDLVAIWAHMGIAARTIAISLGLMAIAVVAISIDRLWALFSWSRKSKAVAEGAAAALKSGQFSSLVSELDGNEQPLARMLRAGLTTYTEGMSSPKHAEMAVELARRELSRVLEVIASDCRRGMSFLASIASVAPFVGLLGTVLGIISSFETIGSTGSGGLGSVATGIAEALVVTGIGLGVAIPAVLLFNFISGKIDRFDLLLQNASGELVDELEKNHAVGQEHQIAA